MSDASLIDRFLAGGEVPAREKRPASILSVREPIPMLDLSFDENFLSLANLSSILDRPNYSIL